MHWKLKAAIQNTIAALPSSASYALHYWLQRRFGGLRMSDPVDRLVAGIETWKRILERGLDPRERVFLEVGTGQVPIVPLAYWLMGARRTITIDVNPYLKEELVRQTVEHIAGHQKSIADLFGELLQQQRMNDLLRLHATGPVRQRQFLELCSIDYVAGGDAARTGLEPRSIDFHTSYTVLEHIPPEVVTRILVEGSRIIHDDGLFVHLIDYSDHFAHSDRTISLINFLQYSDAEWTRLADNRYMYMNRLRHDDFLALFQSAGHRILATVPSVDERVGRMVADGRLRVDDRFKRTSPEILSIWASWIVSQKADSPASVVAQP
jgi:hypothetical protein